MTFFWNKNEKNENSFSAENGKSRTTVESQFQPSSYPDQLNNTVLSNDDFKFPLPGTLHEPACVLLCMATSSFHRRGQSVTVHVASQWLDRQRGTRYQHHSVTMNSLSCHFVASWRLNYTLKHIIDLNSTLMTVFTVRVGEHNFNVII